MIGHNTKCILNHLSEGPPLLGKSFYHAFYLLLVNEQASMPVYVTCPKYLIMS